MHEYKDGSFCGGKIPTISGNAMIKYYSISTPKINCLYLIGHNMKCTIQPEIYISLRIGTILFTIESECCLRGRIYKDGAVRHNILVTIY